LLAKTVVHRYKGEVEFVEEDWATSKLAQQFGMKYYPAFFVNDVLIARPGDFRNKGGRYNPWIGNVAAHEKFRADLARMIDLALSGRMDTVRSQAAAAPQAEYTELARVPSVGVKTLAGDTVNLAEMSGKVRIVEFWATWCTPCRSTLPWLGELQRQNADRVEVLGIAMESKEEEVRAMADELKLAYPNAMHSAEIGAAFGDILSVPTLFIFDQNGKTAAIFYGAPKNLHEDVQGTITRLLK
jgi:thiol-disulfide isomerase/thioredoxin